MITCRLVPRGGPSPCPPPGPSAGQARWDGDLCWVWGGARTRLRAPLGTRRVAGALYPGRGPR